MREWETEPDRKFWLDDTTGLPCLIVRMPHLGHLFCEAEIRGMIKQIAEKWPWTM